MPRADSTSPAPKRGRPPVEGVTRSTVIPPIRVTPDELADLTEAAHRAGLGLGPWLRLMGLHAAERSRRA